jgi:hypothetical protein
MVDDFVVPRRLSAAHRGVALEEPAKGRRSEQLLASGHRRQRLDEAVPIHGLEEKPVRMSMSATSGFVRRVSATASQPTAAAPTISWPASSRSAGSACAPALGRRRASRWSCREHHLVSLAAASDGDLGHDRPVRRRRRLPVRDRRRHGWHLAHGRRSPARHPPCAEV